MKFFHDHQDNHTNKKYETMTELVCSIVKNHL